jgi:hypothetical protein
MDAYRDAWMRQMLARQNRIVDSHITSSRHGVLRLDLAHRGRRGAR